MPSVTFRFFKPADLIGDLITWRLNEPYSHAAIIADDIVYSSIFPKVLMLPTINKAVNFPPRVGVDYVLPVSDAEYQSIVNWARTRIGKPYDTLALLGWLLGDSALQSKHGTYCFEFCREPLVQLGLLPATKGLVRGDLLIQEIEKLISERTS